MRPTIAVTQIKTRVLRRYECLYFFGSHLALFTISRISSSYIIEKSTAMNSNES